LEAKTTTINEIARNKEYQIPRDDMQVVSVILDPQETVNCRARAMKTGWIETFSLKPKWATAHSHQGIFSKLSQCREKRRINWQSLVFLTTLPIWFVAKRKVSLQAPDPGKILPLNLKEISGEIICQKDSFLCAAKGTEDFLNPAFTKAFRQPGFWWRKGLFGNVKEATDGLFACRRTDSLKKTETIESL